MRATTKQGLNGRRSKNSIMLVDGNEGMRKAEWAPASGEGRLVGGGAKEGWEMESNTLRERVNMALGLAAGLAYWFGQEQQLGIFA
jgi:hypothetical protein